jgi:two-component system, LytTR family, sensor kinase
MEKPALYNVLNLRKPISHIAFLVFSLAVTVIIAGTGKGDGSITFSVGTFIMLFAQLEVFIYFGNRLFADLTFDRSPGEITRIVSVRFMIFLAICLFVSMVLFIILQYLGLLINGQNISNVFHEFIHTGFMSWFKSTIAGLTLGAVIFIILLWQASLKREQKLREENLIFQNETLKNQVNPHFLFNSLNTLSSLVATRPDVAEEFISRLSSIYRYILENSSKDRVPLGVELSFIRDYFYLHQIRDDGKISLDIKAEDTSGFNILPVSLQILVENCIKHNKATRDKPLMILIYLENRHIVVRNNLQRMAVSMKSTEIGLKNLAQRIKLVSARELIVEETATDFIVKIPLL